MALWLSLGGLAAVVLLLLLRPMLSAGGAVGASRAEHDLEVFRAQLKELDRDRDRGLLLEQEAEAARREVERRLLAAGQRASQSRTMSTFDWRGRTALALLLVIALPAAATALYLSLGSPGLPGQPFASRPAPVQTAQDDERLAALATFEQRSRDNPADTANWLNLGRVHFALGRYEDAAAAFARAIDLTDRHPGAVSLYGEALVYAAEGFVTEGARTAFGDALAADPNEPRARFYRALADYQAGRRERALDDWLDLASGAPPDAVWLPAVRDRIRAVATELGLDAEALIAEAVPQVAQLPPDQQLEQIRGMVDGLAARLADTPDDLEGWLMLGRSYLVLGEPRNAVDALGRAAELAPDRPQILAALLVATITAAEQDPALAETIPALTDRVLNLDPDNVDALWFAGLAAERSGDPTGAEAYWRRLLALLPASGEEYRIVTGRLDALARPR